jgi:hypothetical protein
MTEDRFSELRLILGAFNTGILQDLLTLETVMHEQKITMDEIREYIQKIKEFYKTRVGGVKNTGPQGGCC